MTDTLADLLKTLATLWPRVNSRSLLAWTSSPFTARRKLGGYLTFAWGYVFGSIHAQPLLGCASDVRYDRRRAD